MMKLITETERARELRDKLRDHIESGTGGRGGWGFNLSDDEATALIAAALQRERDEEGRGTITQAQAAEWHTQLVQAEGKAKALREALAYYADIGNYLPHRDAIIPVYAVDHSGGLARAALAAEGEA
jgi:hypothetical protein